jgi:hypothetical protein
LEGMALNSSIKFSHYCFSPFKVIF